MCCIPPFANRLIISTSATIKKFEIPHKSKFRMDFFAARKIEISLFSTVEICMTTRAFHQSIKSARKKVHRNQKPRGKRNLHFDACIVEKERGSPIYLQTKV